MALKLSVRNYLVGVILLFLFVGDASCDQLRYNKHSSKHATSVLDDLLKEDKYDKRFRPNFGGDPVTISVNLYIKSLGPVSETDEVYSIDTYYRQMWYDQRLKFNISGLEEFSLNWSFLGKVWVPDTYFINGMKSYLHSITVPNKFLRLRNDGYLTYSMRLTIKASCQMNLRTFPLDSQSCPLEIGSYAYGTRDVKYEWIEKNPVTREEGVYLAQYDLVRMDTKKEVRLSSRGDNFSVVSVDFFMKRHTGYFLLQVYVPCALIVSCSWVSFWIDPNAVPARVSLGVTTVLSLTTLGFGGRSQMPRTSYATALDWFVILCFAFVFASMVEYALINYIDKMTKDVKAKVAGKKPKPEKPEIMTEGPDDKDETDKLGHFEKLKVFAKRIVQLRRFTSWVKRKVADPYEFLKGGSTTWNWFRVLSMAGVFYLHVLMHYFHKLFLFPV